MMSSGRRNNREYDDFDLDEQRVKRASRNRHGMKIINKFVEEDFLEDFFDDVDDDSVKNTKQTKRKH